MGRLKKVYAYQIKENKKYKGRYIILIKQPEIEGNNFSNLYKVKLTNDMKLPKTVEEINSCEFVKMRACPYELRMFPIMGGLNYDEALQNYKDATLPDSDNNLFNYDYSFIFTRKEKKSSLIYIGEFDVNDNPPYEKKTANHYTPAYGFIGKLEKYTIEGYEFNNKKTGFLYNERERKEYIQSRINFQNENSIELKEWMANYNSQLYNYSFGYKLLDSDVTNMAITDYKKCYDEYKILKKKLNSADSDESERLKEIDLLSYQVNELTESDVKQGEEQELDSERTALMSFEKIFSFFFCHARIKSKRRYN